jgi:hypothetical protein
MKIVVSLLDAGFEFGDLLVKREHIDRDLGREFSAAVIGADDSLAKITIIASYVIPHAL